MNKRKSLVIFLTNESLISPIVYFQGLPQIKALAKKGIPYYVFSVERDDNLNIRITEMELNKIGIKWFKFKRRNFHFISWIVLLNIEFCMKAFLLSLFGNKIIWHVRSYPIYPTALLFKWLFGSKIIFDMRGLYVDELVEIGRLTNKKIYKFMKWFEKIALESANEIVVVSKCFKLHLEERVRKREIKLDFNKIHVIPNCVDLSHFYIDVEKRKLLREVNGINNRLVFIYSGSLQSWQMINEMFEFFFNIYKYAPHSIFLFLTYENLIGIKNLSKLYGIPEESIKVKSVSPEDMADWLIMGDCGIVFRKPSIITKVSCPIKFAQYLACGLPVITNKGVGDLEEIIKKYDVGKIIDIQNRNERILAAKNIVDYLYSNIDKIRSKCRVAAEKEFGIDMSISSYYNILEKYLGK
ncbi:MAG: glycosyltransferase [Actinomycetota bacterium]|nr:glycosyltransferase [Actinomycetota bacterium]